MNTGGRLAVYGAVVAVAFASAFGVGNLTGNPEDPEAAPTEPAADAADAALAAPGESAGTAAPAQAGEAAGGLPAGLQVAASGYTLSPVTAPESAGAAGTLTFQVLGPDGEPVTEFTESHEEELHLIVVRADTAEYRHVHPTLAPDGTWSIDWTWPTGGTYKVFADFTPTALGTGLTLARFVDVAGDYAPAPASPHPTVAEVDGYTVTLTGELVAGAGSTVTATIARDGQPVTRLQPYLGAYGHLVALRGGDLAYLHVHPEGEPGDGVTEPGPEVSFVVETLTAGEYRLFLDFKVDGQVRTAEFTLTASGVAGGADADTRDPGHDPSEDDDHGH